jgi:hypothetical protein
MSGDNVNLKSGHPSTPLIDALFRSAIAVGVASLRFFDRLKS